MLGRVLSPDLNWTFRDGILSILRYGVADRGRACLVKSKRAPHPRVVADQLFALVARVGEEVVVARDAVGALVRLDVLAAVQGLLAVVAVETVRHGSDLQAGQGQTAREHSGQHSKNSAEAVEGREGSVSRRDSVTFPPRHSSGISPQTFTASVYTVKRFWLVMKVSSGKAHRVSE